MAGCAAGRSAVGRVGLKGCVGVGVVGEYRALQHARARSGQPIRMIATNGGDVGSASAPDQPPDLPNQVARCRDGRTRRCYRCIRSEEHTSELKSLMRISYAVFCLKK